METKALTNTEGFRLSLSTLESLYRSRLTGEILLSSKREEVTMLEAKQLNEIDKDILENLNSEVLVESASISQGTLEIQLNPDVLYLAYLDEGMDEAVARELSLLATNGYTYHIQRSRNGEFELPKNIISLTDPFRNVLWARESYLAVA